MTRKPTSDALLEFSRVYRSTRSRKPRRFGRPVNGSVFANSRYRARETSSERLNVPIMNTGSQITATDTAQLTNADARPSAAAIDTDHANAMATIVCPIMTRLLDAIAAIAGIAESSVTMPRAAAGSVTKYAAREIPAIPTSPRTENIRSDNFPTTSVIKKIAVVVAHTPSRYTGAPSRTNDGDNSVIAGRGIAPAVLMRTAIDRASVRSRKLAYRPYSPPGLMHETLNEPTHRTTATPRIDTLEYPSRRSWRRRTCTANIRS